MTKEEIEKQIGIPVSTLADICNCKDSDRLVTILSISFNAGENKGVAHTHEWYAKMFRRSEMFGGKVVISQQPLNVVGYVDL